MSFTTKLTIDRWFLYFLYCLWWLEVSWRLKDPLSVLSTAGAWFYLLNFVTNLCVITNAFLIAVTSQFIDREAYNNIFQEDYEMEVCGNNTDCTLGFVKWSTSEFPMTSLLVSTSSSSSLGTNNTAFPLFTVQQLPLYNASTNYSSVVSVPSQWLWFGMYVKCSTHTFTWDLLTY